MIKTLPRKGIESRPNKFAFAGCEKTMNSRPLASRLIVNIAVSGCTWWKEQRSYAFCLYPFHLEPKFPVDVYVHLDFECKLLGVNNYTRFVVLNLS